MALEGPPVARHVDQAARSVSQEAGWASAVGAFNAENGQNEQPEPQLAEQLDHIITGIENELAGPPSGPELNFYTNGFESCPPVPMRTLS
jgi:hypothetical protein